MFKKIGLFVLLCLIAVGAFGLLARRRVVCLGRFGAALRREVATFAQVLGLLARHGKQRLGLSLLLTAVQWICRYSVLSALVAGLGLDFSPLTFFVLQWAIFALGMFMPTPSSIGGMEALFLMFYQPLLPSGDLMPVMLYWRSLTCYLPLVLDLVILSFFKVSARLARA